MLYINEVVTPAQTHTFVICFDSTCIWLKRCPSSIHISLLKLIESTIRSLKISLIESIMWSLKISLIGSIMWLLEVSLVESIMWSLKISLIQLYLNLFFNLEHNFYKSLRKLYVYQLTIASFYHILSSVLWCVFVITSLMSTRLYRVFILVVEHAKR